MKKTVFYSFGLFSCFLVFLFSSCENLNTDLPYTDVEKYRISGGFLFSEGTEAVDIYNCLMKEGLSNNSEITLKAQSTYKITKIVVVQGEKKEFPKTRDIAKMRINYTEKGNEIHEYVITLYFDDGSTDFYSDVTWNGKPEEKPTLYCVFTYEWQRQTSNKWRNDKILGDLTVKL